MRIRNLFLQKSSHKIRIDCIVNKHQNKIGETCSFKPSSPPAAHTTGAWGACGTYSALHLHPSLSYCLPPLSPSMRTWRPPTRRRPRLCCSQGQGAGDGTLDAHLGSWGKAPSRGWRVQAESAGAGAPTVRGARGKMSSVAPKGALPALHQDRLRRGVNTITSVSTV
jgi:hypothetical protein